MFQLRRSGSLYMPGRHFASPTALFLRLQERLPSLQYASSALRPQSIFRCLPEPRDGLRTALERICIPSGRSCFGRRIRQANVLGWSHPRSGPPACIVQSRQPNRPSFRGRLSGEFTHRNSLSCAADFTRAAIYWRTALKINQVTHAPTPKTATIASCRWSTGFSLLLYNARKMER